MEPPQHAACALAGTQRNRKQQRSDGCHAILKRQHSVLHEALAPGLAHAVVSVAHKSATAHTQIEQSSL
jgi:hypothetical protein